MSRPSFPFHGIFASLGQDQTDEQGMPSLTPQPSPLGPPKQVSQTTSSSGTQVGQVAVDIYEQDGYYIIKSLLAGVSMNDLDIEITDNVLTIRGTRKQNDQIPQDQYYLQECFWGEFSRSVTLPFSIDPKKVKATFNKESVLKIIIPREEKVKIVRISEG